VGGCHAFVDAEVSQNATNQVTLKFLAYALKRPFENAEWLKMMASYAKICQVHTSKTHYI
jgi:hypothetical protein